MAEETNKQTKTMKQNYLICAMEREEINKKQINKKRKNTTTEL